MTRIQEARDMIFDAQPGWSMHTVDAIEALIDAKLSESAAGRRFRRGDRIETTDEPKFYGVVKWHDGDIVAFVEPDDDHEWEYPADRVSLVEDREAEPGGGEGEEEGVRAMYEAYRAHYRARGNYAVPWEHLSDANQAAHLSAFRFARDIGRKQEREALLLPEPGVNATVRE